MHNFNKFVAGVKMANNFVAILPHNKEQDLGVAFPIFEMWKITDILMYIALSYKV